MEHVHWISGIVIFLCLLSIFFLTRLAFNESQHIMQSSKFRFNCFLIQHLIFIGFMVAFIMRKQTYELVKWGFALSLTHSILVTVTELSVYFLRYSNKRYQISTVMPSELAYLNCYFLIYMYSLIACILTGLFLLLTNCCIWFQTYKIKKSIRESIHSVRYSSQIGGSECSICITQITNEQPLLQIKCKHIFHQDCLMEWLKRNQTCPTCRFKIFEELEQEDVGVEVQVQVQEPVQN